MLLHKLPSNYILSYTTQEGVRLIGHLLLINHRTKQYIKLRISKNAAMQRPCKALHGKTQGHKNRYRTK